MHGAKVLFIIPAYNEAGNISCVLTNLANRFPEFDRLVIDDCSTDQTAACARGQNALVISLPFNLGIGGAVQTGFQYAREHGYDAAVQFDGDGQHDAGFVSAVLEPVLSGSCDMCVGSRFLAQEGEFKSSFLRQIGIGFFSFLIGALTGRRMSDPTSGFRAYGRKMIQLFSEYYPVDFPEPESIVIAQRYEGRIAEVPVVMHSRHAGFSSIRNIKTAYYMLKVTLAIIVCLVRKTREIDFSGQGCRSTEQGKRSDP